MSDLLDSLVVGAGISGLLAGRQLAESGFRVLVLDKSRGLGGRMATRREAGETFDHGAQFFTAREPRFQSLVEHWVEEGVVAPWFGGTPESPHCRYRGVPGMTALPKHLAEGLAVERSAKVIDLSWRDERWEARAEDDRTWSARSVLLSAPVPQSLALLEAGGVALDPELQKGLQRIRYHPCLALMVTLEAGSPGLTPPGWARPASGPVAWIADNRSKGVSASDRPALIMHASPAFSAKHYEAPEEEIIPLLLEAAAPWLTGAVCFTRLQRWRYSLPAVSHSGRFAADPVRRLVFCGDGFGEPRVEGAALSGLAAADLLTGLLR